MNRFALRALLALVLPLSLIYIGAMFSGSFGGWSGRAISDEAIVEWRKNDFGIVNDIVAYHNANAGSSYNPSLGGNLVGQSMIAFSVFPERTSYLGTPTVTRDEIVRFIEANADLLHLSFLGVGTWRNPTTGKTEIDVMVTLSSRTKEQRERILSLARSFNRKAVYDLELQQEIDLGGSGQALPNLPPIEERLDMTKAMFTRKD